MNSLTAAQKIGQLFFIGIPGPEIDRTTREIIDMVQPGGVCLFARNIRERSQTRELLDGLRELLPLAPLLSVDQEGGLVDRLRRVMTPMPAAEKIRTEADAATLGSIVGETLRRFGFNMDFAPVVDVMDESRAAHSNGLQSRAFGSSTADVTRMASAFLSALQTEGVLGCAKHFPGLGASRVDSHKELPTVSIDEEELVSTDLGPYRDLIGGGQLYSVMVAHAAFPNYRLQEKDQNGKLLPSSLSPAIISKLLRGELGFNGLVVTDDLEMGAIVENYSIGGACKLAIDAGADMLAICASTDRIKEGFDALNQALESGEISESRVDRSIEHIDAIRGLLQPPLDLDDARLEQLSALIGDMNDRLS